MNSVKVTTPQIGFDRFIPLDWATCSLNVRSGVEIPDALEDMLTNAELGAQSKKKTRSVLKGLWLSPRVDLIDFADRGIGIRDVVPDVSIPGRPYSRPTTPRSPSMPYRSGKPTAPRSTGATWPTSAVRENSWRFP